MTTQNWQCPACGLTTDVATERAQRTVSTVLADSAVGPRSFHIVSVVCPNRLCAQLCVSVEMFAVEPDASGVLGEGAEVLREWNLMPGPRGRCLPSQVPESVAEEFSQASQILALSPPASATLARRCLQAIVRDFWEIKKTFLADELDAIKDRVNDETWEAIMSVRNTGQVGKHFEKGTNVMIDVEPDEPRLLLNLIEYLVEDWYMARHRRQQRLQAIKNRSLAPPE